MKINIRLNAEILDIKTGRRCDECRLCCKVMAVGHEGDDFFKPAGPWCEHAFSGGCRIYDSRPFACSNFECGWLRGLFPDDFRPDKAQVIVALELSVGNELRDEYGGLVMKDSPVWCVYERTPGACREKKGQQIVQELSRITVQYSEEAGMQGPFPICIIPSATGLRQMWVPPAMPDGKHRMVFVPCYRPGEKPIHTKGTT